MTALEWRSVLSFELDVSDEPLSQILLEERRKLEKVTRSAGATSPAFKQAFHAVHEGISLGQPLTSLLTNVLHVRAYAVGIGGEHFRRMPLTSEALTCIDQFRPLPSRQMMENLFDWYCTDYDEMPNCREVQRWLKNGAAKRPEFKHWKRLLSNNAPKYLAESASKKGISLTEFVNTLGLEKIQAGRLYTAAQNLFYLESLKKLKPNEDSPLLTQLADPQVFNSIYRPGVLLGVEVLRILITCLPSSEPLGESWRTVINVIGGDPRLPDNSPIYRKWWKPLGDELIQKTRGWFSRMDLKIFLRVIEEHGKSSRDPTMQRMFPARKRFLEGLFDNGFVKDSRLYLSRGAANYVENHINKDDLPKFSIVKDQDKSLIYLNLDGVHLIEGSHNCKLWLHRDLAPKSILKNYSSMQPSYYQLTQGIVSSQHKSITHMPGIWLAQAIEAMRHFGIQVSVEQVMDKDDAKNHIRRHGN